MKAAFIGDFTKCLVALALLSQITGCMTVEGNACVGDANNCNSSSSVGENTSDTGAGNPVDSISLSWVAPSQRDNGDSISMSEIAGYRIYYGTVQGAYEHQIEINSGSIDQATLDDLSGGTYYMVVTTIDTDGRESAYSDELEATI